MIQEELQFESLRSM